MPIGSLAVLNKTFMLVSLCLCIILYVYCVYVYRYMWAIQIYNINNYLPRNDFASEVSWLFKLKLKLATTSCVWNTARLTNFSSRDFVQQVPEVVSLQISRFWPEKMQKKLLYLSIIGNNILIFAVKKHIYFNHNELKSFIKAVKGSTGFKNGLD